MGQHLCRAVAGDAGGQQKLARQVEAVEFRILGQIAQDVGQLQGFAQRQGEPLGRGIGAVEDTDGQHADRAGDAAAIEAQGVEVGGAHAAGSLFRHIHRHAVDQRLELRPRQAVALDGALQRGGERTVGGAADIEVTDVAPPDVERRALGGGIPRFVGDVVDAAAEGIDGEHRSPLGRGQQTHRPVEGAA